MIVRLSPPRSKATVRRALGVSLIVASSAMAGCDPCSGVLACSASSDSPYLAADGQIVNAATGVGVDGVRVDVIRRSGVAVEQDSFSVVTTNGGHWRVQFTPRSSGTIDAEAVVSTPSGSHYRVPGIRLASAARIGEATIIDRWVETPYFPNAGELFVRGTADQRITGTPVAFRRTGGVQLMGPGVHGDVVESATDFAGRVPLFSTEGKGVYSNEVGAVIGDLIVRRSATDSSVHPGLSVSSTYIYRAPTGILRLAIGPSLDYQAEFYSRATLARLPDVEVFFERVSGPATDPATFTTRSDATGRFRFPLRTSTSGVVQGRLIFRAPIPSTPETLTVALPTYEADSRRFYGVIGAGAHLPYYGILLRGPAGIDGISVDVTRTSGIEIQPSTFTTVTQNGGTFGIHAAPQSLGEVVVDLSFRLPAPYRPYVVHGVKLATADRDASDRLVGVFSVDGLP